MALPVEGTTRAPLIDSLRQNLRHQEILKGHAMLAPLHHCSSALFCTGLFVYLRKAQSPLPDPLVRPTRSKEILMLVSLGLFVCVNERITAQHLGW
ncbi:MAG: hypothetical protein A4E63_03200 [Syntrophorhabdus sp. PtaU1.Bin050]|nr:MAG: hypothetical protein A4E63_03200 [Syntrophorhabdus sp. PtaU1.Bin050]